MRPARARTANELDPNLVTLLAALIGPAGLGGAVLLVLDRRKKADAVAAESPPPPGGAERRASDALGAVLDELVEARTETRNYRQQIWRCGVEECPVRDRLRGEQ